MSLPTSADLVSYLRIESEESAAESSLYTALIARATAMVEAWLDRPILTVVDMEFVDEARSDCGWITKLLVPMTPFDPDTLLIEDANGTAADPGTYRAKGLTGEVIANPGMIWANPPYTLTCDVGLQLHPQYATRIEPVLSQAILDVAADLYHARNPRAASESGGGGASTTYVNQVFPERIKAALAPYRREFAV